MFCRQLLNKHFMSKNHIQKSLFVIYLTNSCWRVPILLELTVCKAHIKSFCSELSCNDLTCSKFALSIALLLALHALRTCDRLYGCVCFCLLRLSAPPPLAGRIMEINFITTCQAPLVREQSQSRIKLHPAGEKVVRGAVFLMLHFLMERWNSVTV